MRLAEKISRFFQSKSKFILKYFTYVLCIFIFIFVLIVSLVSYSHLNKQIADTYYYFSLNKLEKLKSDFDSQHSALKNLFIQTDFDNDIHSLFYMEDDVTTAYNASMTLKKYSSFVTFVSSLSIYDSKKDIMYSSSTELMSLDYIGMSFEQLRSDSSYSFREFVIPSSERILYSYTMSDPDYLLLAMIPPSTLYEPFASYCENGTELFVTNKDGTLIYSSDTSGSVLPDKYISTANSDKKYTFMRFNRAKHMCFSIYSPSTGYTYTTLIPYTYITKDFIPQRNYYIFVIVILLALIVSVSYFILSAMKAPINQMIENSTLYKNYEYNEKLRQTEADILTYISTEFPDNNISTVAYEHLKKYITENSDIFMLMSFAIDNVKMLKATDSIDLMRYGIANICLETTEKYCRAICISDTKTTITLIIINNGDVTASVLRSCASECIDLVENHLSVSITASISNETDFEHLSNAYDELKKIRNYRYIYGHGSILTPDILTDEATGYSEASVLFKSLTSALNSNLFDSALAECDKFIAALKKLPVERVHLFAMQFIMFFSEYTDKLSANHQLAEDIDSIEFSDHITSAETLDDVSEYIKQQISNISEIFIKKESNKYSKITEQVSEMIDKNFTDTTFCTDSIAQSFNLSTVYLSRIYKRETGLALSNVILEKRLAHAANLLITTTRPIKDIAFESGFINDSYFIVLFKKRYGCTPAFYKTENEKKGK